MTRQWSVMVDQTRARKIEDQNYWNRIYSVIKIHRKIRYINCQQLNKCKTFAMELVVTFAITILALISFVGIIVLIAFTVRSRCCKTSDLISEQHKQVSRSDAQLIGEHGGRGMQEDVGMGVELDDVQILNPKLEELLNNDQWVEEAAELVPHCLFILNTCRDLAVSSVNLVNESMQKGHSRPSQTALYQIELATKRINPRVDDIIESFNPPLDTKLLEARFTTLVFAVSQLILTIKHACHFSGSLDWIDRQLEEVEYHRQLLRQANTAREATMQGENNQTGHQAEGEVSNHM